jgi:hypothetical protein
MISLEPPADAEVDGVLIQGVLVLLQQYQNALDLDIVNHTSSTTDPHRTA